MRRILCAVLVLFGLSKTMAQQTIQSGYILSEHHQKIIKLLEDQERNLWAAEKPTGIKQRVIAQSYHAGTSFDSTAFKYSGRRGSRFNYNLFSFPRFMNLSFDTLNPRVFSPFYLLADTIATFTDTPMYADYCSYRPDNQIQNLFTDYFDEDYTIRHTRWYMDYNAEGLEKVRYQWQTTSSVLGDTAIMIRNFYVAGKRTIDSIWRRDNSNWILGSYIRHGYDASNRWLNDSTFAVTPGSSSSQLAQAISITYYADSRIKTFETEIFSDGMLWQKIADSFGYQIGIPYSTYWRSESTVPEFPSHTITEEKRFPGSNGLPDSVETSFTQTDNSIRRQTYHFQYNSLGNPEYVLGYDESNTSGIPDRKYHFYYENYDDGLSISNAAKKKPVKIYPNPFTNMLTIDVPSRELTKAILEWYNIFGQRLHIQQTVLEKGQNLITSPELSAGIYILHLKDESGNIQSWKLEKR